MIATDVRRLLGEAGVDDTQVLWAEPSERPPSAPSHVWIVWPVGEEVILGGMDRGTFAAYARFGDASLAAEILQRWLSPVLPPAPRDGVTLHDAALAVADGLIGSGAPDGALREGGVVAASALPVGTPLDHVGNASGHVLYLFDTAMSARSLPPTDLNVDRMGFVLNAPLPDTCTVSLAPAWFGQPGGNVVVTLDRVIAHYCDQGLLAPFQPAPSQPASGSVNGD